MLLHMLESNKLMLDQNKLMVRSNNLCSDQMYLYLDQHSDHFYNFHILGEVETLHILEEQI